MTDPRSFPSLPPQGWYPDPADPARERFWDGGTWTQNVRVPAPPPSAFPPPGMTPAAPALPDWARTPAAGTGSVPGQVPSTADGVPLASWGIRAVAAVVDNVVLSILTSLLVVLVAPAYVERVAASTAAWIQAVEAASAAGNAGAMPPLPITEQDANYLALVLAAVTLLYGLLLLRFVGATVGQLMVGIRVVPVDKGREQQGLPWLPALSRSLAWTVLSSVGYLLPVQVVSVLWALFQPKRQTFPDLLARTQVVRRRKG